MGEIDENWDEGDGFMEPGDESDGHLPMPSLFPEEAGFSEDAGVDEDADDDDELREDMGELGKPEKSEKPTLSLEGLKQLIEGREIPTGWEKAPSLEEIKLFVRCLTLTPERLEFLTGVPLQRMEGVDCFEVRPVHVDVILKILRKIQSFSRDERIPGLAHPNLSHAVFCAIARLLKPATDQINPLAVRLEEIESDIVERGKIRPVEGRIIREMRKVIANLSGPRGEEGELKDAEEFLDGFLERIEQRKNPSPEEASEMAEIKKKLCLLRGDPRYRKLFRCLQECNLRFVAGVARMDTDDFVRGILGLTKAIERFDTERGVKFLTYAYYWIMHEIGRYRCDEDRHIRLPAHRSQIVSLFLNAERYFETSGITPTDEDFAKYMNAWMAFAPLARKELEKLIRARSELPKGRDGSGSRRYGSFQYLRMITVAMVREGISGKREIPPLPEGRRRVTPEMVATLRGDQDFVVSLEEPVRAHFGDKDGRMTWRDCVSYDPVSAGSLRSAGYLGPERSLEMAEVHELMAELPADMHSLLRMVLFDEMTLRDAGKWVARKWGPGGVGIGREAVRQKMQIILQFLARRARKGAPECFPNSPLSFAEVEGSYQSGAPRDWRALMKRLMEKDQADQEEARSRRSMVPTSREVVVGALSDSAVDETAGDVGAEVAVAIGNVCRGKGSDGEVVDP